ncbi:MAG: VCBS repeat-containing protein [Planctomycetes bacterium]|nr:VCBS repeat-containing protein [Planctomycetota bacterium]
MKNIRRSRRQDRSGRPRLSCLTFESLEQRFCLSAVVVTGTAGRSGLVRVLDATNGTELARMQPLGIDIAGGIRVAVGDVNADGVADFAFGAGSGRGRVVVYDGVTRAPLATGLRSVLPFGNNYRGGVHVALGDVDRDGRADLVVGTDGVGQWAAMRRVQVYDVATGATKGVFRTTGAALGSDGRRPQGGVRVAVRDMNNDARGDVITVTGRGARQHVGVRSMGGEAVGDLGSVVLTVGQAAGPAFVAATNRDLDLVPEVVVSLPGRLQLYNLDGAGRLFEVDRVATGIAGASRPIGTVDSDGNNVAEAVIGGVSEGRVGLRALAGNGSIQPLGAVAGNTLANHFVAGTDRATFNGIVSTQATSGSQLARLGIYDPATNTFSEPVTPSVGPSPYAGKNVYFISHGWAPEWRAAVDAYAQANPGSFLKWWQTTNATLPDAPSSTPASTWMFDPTYGPSDDFVVSPQGMAATLAANDPNAVVIAFSWIDESATTSVFSAYPSEARTYRNGLRLAEAITELLGLDSGVTLGDVGAPKVHVMGHSHGSKVATVAAAALRRSNQVVQQLSVLDSPESYLTVKIDANNLLWYYLPDVQPGRAAGTTFVDNTISYFDGTYANFPGLSNVVDVSLAPTVLYGNFAVSENHSYAAAWYAGATASNSGYGLGWSPLLHPEVPPTLLPGYRQPWTSPTPQTQFVLTGKPTPAPQTPVFTASSLTDVTTTGNASMNAGVISLATSTASKSASVTGQLDFESASYGLVFTFEFTNATAGDQLSVTIGGLVDTYQYFVVDGASAGSGVHSATVSVYSSWGGKYPVTFALASASGTTNPSLTIKDIEQITFAA